jgi:YHS domain-containing protein
MAAVAGCGICGPSARIPANAPPARDTVGNAPADNLPGLKELGEADRQLAMRQKICPVSGGPLGSMGKPYRMEVKGHVIFLCCEHCKDEVDKDPDGILRRVDALLANK